MKKTNSVDSQATTPPSSITTIIDDDDDDDNVHHNVNVNENHIIFDLDYVDSAPVALIIDKSKGQLLEQIKGQLLEQIKGQLLDEFKDLLKTQSVDKSLLIKILIRGMEIMETTTVKGKEQKDLVIDILIQILETDGLNVSHKDLLIHFLKEDANAFIDVIVDASRGKININQVESVVTNCIQYLFICLKKK